MKSKQIVKKSWMTTTVGEFSPFEYGKGLPKKKRAIGNIPVYGSNRIIGYHNESLVDGPAIILGRKGTIGSVQYSKTPCWPIDTTFFIRPNDDIDMRYASYLLKNLGLENMNTDTAVPGLNRNRAHEITIEVPSTKNEQQKISQIIGVIDDRIELLQNINNILEKLNFIIFKSWFVEYKGQKEFIDSELGKIPKGWLVKSIGNFIELIKGFSYRGSEKFVFPKNYVFVTLNNIKQGGGFKPKYFWLESSRIKEKHFVREFDLIMANIHFGVGGSNVARLLGSVALVNFPYNYQKEYGVFSLDITKIIATEEIRFYLYYLLKSRQEEIASTYHKGTSIRRLDEPGFLKQFKIIIPPTTILNDFKKIVHPSIKEIMNNEKQISHLNKTRDFILPKLVSGEIIP